jgi:hypothetical protein
MVEDMKLDYDEVDLKEIEKEVSSKFKWTHNLWIGFRIFYLTAS